MFVAAYEQGHNREYMEHLWYSNVVSDDEEECEDLKQVHTTKGHVPLFKPVLCDGTL